MYNFIETKKARAKLFLKFYFATIVLLIASGVGLALLPFAVAITSYIVFFWTVVTLTIIYFAALFPFLQSVKILESNDMVCTVEDILLEKPTLLKSKIYCGSKAFLCKRPCVVIPYSDVAWVYLYRRTAYGVVTVEKAVIIYTKSGKKYSLNIDEDEFKWLLDKFIVVYSPDIIIGFSSDRKALYYQKNPKAMATKKRRLTIAGSIVLAVSVLFVILAVTVAAQMVPVLVIAGILAVIGGILFITGRRK